MKSKIPILFFILSVFAALTFSCKKNKETSNLLTDVDGNSYKTIKIGTQLWMAENLKTTKLNDGTPITLTSDASSWSNLTTGSFCWYNNDEASSKDAYGALYNGYTIATGLVCPTGWHVPEKTEWLLLRDFLGDSLNAGGKMKEVGTLHWLSPNKDADNSSGFTATGAGLRYFEGTFSSVLTFSAIWTATESADSDLWYVALYYGDPSCTLNHRNKKHGFSVRCVKD
jgi:uncharacterized protein (TIGR02145 family)